LNDLRVAADAPSPLQAFLDAVAIEARDAQGPPDRKRRETKAKTRRESRSVAAFVARLRLNAVALTAGARRGRCIGTKATEAERCSRAAFVVMVESVASSHCLQASSDSESYTSRRNNVPGTGLPMIRER